MSVSDENKTKKTNVSENSQYQVGENLTIGNTSHNKTNNINVTLGLNAKVIAMILTFCLVLIVGWKTWPSGGEQGHPEKPGTELTESPSDKEDKVKNPDEVDSKPALSTSQTNKPVKPKVKESKTVFLNIVATNQDYSEIVKSNLGQAFQSKNIQYSVSKENNARQRELRCSLRVEREDVSVGIRTVLYLEFILTIALYNADGNVINNKITQSEKITVYKVSEIPAALGSWLRSNRERLLPGSLGDNI